MVRGPVQGAVHDVAPSVGVPAFVALVSRGLRAAPRRWSGGGGRRRPCRRRGDSGAPTRADGPDVLVPTVGQRAEVAVRRASAGGGPQRLPRTPSPRGGAPVGAGRARRASGRSEAGPHGAG